MKSFIRNYIKNTKKRTKLLLSLGLVINVGYASYNIFTGFLYGSVWFYFVAIYYVMLCCIKFFLLLRGFEKNKNFNMRICGVLLLILNLSITALIYITIEKGATHFYKNSVIWTAVGYTLFRITAAAIDIRSLYRRFDPVLYCVKGLSLSVAMMSLFSLQTALLDRFLSNPTLRAGLNILTGTAVGVAVNVIAVRRISKHE